MMNAISVRRARERILGFTRNPRYSKAFRWIRLIAISVVVACTLFYGYLLLRYIIANTVTGYLLIFWTGCILWIVGRKSVRWLKIPRPHSHRMKVTLIILLMIWFLLESALRWAGICKSYNEKIGYYYSSGFVEDAELNKRHRDLYVHPPYYRYKDDRKEFNYEIRCNADGLRDIDHPLKKEKGEFRIICVGNSFTEGIGAPQDSTWPKLLEWNLNRQSDRRITVFNAGISGTDPFFEYELLRRKMLQYEPDLVLLALGSTDIAQYRFRGGFERFTPDGLRFRNGPAWERLYAASYISRVIIRAWVGNKHFFPSAGACAADSIIALAETEKCLRKFRTLAIEKGFPLVFIFIDEESSPYNTVITKLKSENLVPVIDLYEYVMNTEKVGKTERKAYYWPVDGHCNSRGYAMFARGVEKNLKELGIIDSLMKKK